jgi:hypothetical protein
MVAITMKNLLLVAAMLGAAPAITSAQRFYEDGSLAARGRYSVREYIDEQIDLALREYLEGDEEELVSRAKRPPRPQPTIKKRDYDEGELESRAKRPPRPQPTIKKRDYDEGELEGRGKPKPPRPQPTIKK